MASSARVLHLSVLVCAALCPLAAASEVLFHDGFEKGAAHWRTYHREPGRQTFASVEGSAAEGKHFLRVQCPGDSKLEGVCATVKRVKPHSLCTFSAQVRGQGQVWLMVIADNGWLYARGTVALSQQWQPVSLTKLCGPKAASVAVYFVTKTAHRATFEIDDVRVVREPDPPASRAAVEAFRLEAEDYAPAPKLVKAEPDALGGKAVQLGRYGCLAGLPAPVSLAPAFCYLRVRPGGPTDTYTLAARIAGYNHKLATIKPRPGAGWQWLRFPGYGLAVARGSASICVGQPKQGMAAALVDAVVFAAQGDLSPDRLADAPALDRGRPLLAAGRCAQAPAIDGQGDDPCWAECVQVEDFSLSGVQAAASQATVAKVCYDSQRLYVTFRCREYVLQHEANQLHAFRQEHTERDATVWDDDSVVVMLGPTRAGPLFDVFCNARGTIDDARLPRSDLWGARDGSWNGDVQAAARVGNGFWEVEMSIAFQSMGVAAPAPGERWRLCLGRIAKHAKETSAWNPSPAGFHQLDTLGTLVFWPRVGGARAALPGKLSSGKNSVGLGRAESADPALAVATVVQGPGVAQRVTALLAPGAQTVAEFQTASRGQVQLACDLFDAATLRPLYLSPRVVRSVKASDAKLRLVTDAPYTVFLNGERVAAGPKADGRGVLSVPLQSGVNAFSFQVDSGRLAASLELPGTTVATDEAWRFRPGSPPAKFAQATFNDSAWSPAAAFGPAAGALVKTGARVVGGGGPGVLRRVIWFEKTYVWPEPDPAQHVPINAAQHLTFSAPGMRGRLLPGFKLHLAVPRHFEVVGSTGYYGTRREDKAEFITGEPRDAERDGKPVRIYTVAANKPLAYRPKVRILELFNVLVRYRGPAQPADEYAFEFWTEAAGGSITECPQSFPVRVTPALRGKQPKELTFQIWGSFFGTMDDLAMKEVSLATMQQAGFNNVVAGDRSDSELGPKYGLTNTMGINFEIWCLDRRDYLQAHADHALIDGAGKPSKKYVCTTRLLREGWPSVEKMLVERIERTQAHVVDWDYESSPFSGYLTCYCPLCLAAFRAHAGLGQAALTAKSIREDHAASWIDFMTTRNAEVGQKFRMVVSACGAKFSMYSGYESDETHRIYGVDWRKIGRRKAAGHVGCGYGRRRDTVTATVAALDGIPLVTGLLMRPYDRSLRERVIPVTKARFLRRLIDSTGGVLVYDRMPLAGRSWYAIGECTRLAADHEDIFLRGQWAMDLAQVEPAAEPGYAIKRLGDRAMVLVLNAGRKPKAFRVTLPPALVRSAKLYYAGSAADPGQPIALSLAPGDAEAIVLTLR